MQMRRRLPLVALGAAIVAMVVPADLSAGPATSGEPLQLTGELHRNDDLSAVAAIGPLLIVASDEGNRIQILEPGDLEGSYRPRGEAIRLLRGEQELDIEALALDGSTLYVLGSHSIKRKKVDPDKGHDENLARMATVSPEPHRKRLFRLELDAETGAPLSTSDSVSLEAVLEDDPILGPFTRVPAVENGINIEGLAVDGKLLFLGFRSPVLREGYVPVMVTRFEKPDDYELRFLQLGGAGVRSLARVRDGFLVLAGPERPLAGPSVVFHWNGRDQVPGAGGQEGRLERLLELTTPRGGTPEGLAVVAEHDQAYEVIVIHDGIPNGHLMRLRIPRPR